MQAMLTIDFDEDACGTILRAYRHYAVSIVLKRTHNYYVATKTIVLSSSGITK
jgi:hypothetical protein